MAPLRPLLRRLLALLAVLAPALVAQAQPVVREDEAKAAFLYNFLLFGEWPAAQQTSGPLMLCVAGPDPFNGALAQYARRTIRERELRIQYGKSSSDSRGCHLLFVPATQSAQLESFAQALSGAPVLLVTDVEDALARGAMVELRPLDRRLGFGVNLRALRQAQLRLPANVLRLAIEVRE